MSADSKACCGSWTVWLSYNLSQADHRRSYVESWASEQRTLLPALLPEAVSARDFTDDRLGDDAIWQAIEVEVGQQLVQVYALPQDRVHVDSTTAALYHDAAGNPLVEFGLRVVYHKLCKCRFSKRA